MKRIGKIFLALAAFFLLTGGIGYAADNFTNPSTGQAPNAAPGQSYQNYQGVPHLMGPRQREGANGPAFSAPRMQMNPNGDRVSPYPPYTAPYPGR